MQPNRYVLFAGILALLSGSTLNAGELEGRWRNGYWTDTNTGHQDPLRARFRQQNDGNYRVVFTGRFAKVIPFRFATTLNVVGDLVDRTDERHPIVVEWAVDDLGVDTDDHPQRVGITSVVGSHLPDRRPHHHHHVKWHPGGQPAVGAAGDSLHPSRVERG